MANRSQMRLQQLTGSLAAIQSDADASYASKALAANVPAADLHDILASMAGAIKRIHGQEFSNQDAGAFSHTIDVTGEVKASSHISGSGDLSIAIDGYFGGALDATGNIVTGGEFIGSLTSNLSASNGISIDQIFDNSANSVVSIDSAWLGQQFSVVDTNSINMTYNNAGEFQADLRLGSADALIVDADGLDLKGTIAGARTFSDAIDMDSSLTVDGVVTLGTADTADVSILSDLSVAQNLTVQGDLLVQGDTVTVNVGEMLVEDKDIVVAKNGTDAAALDGAGIKVGDSGTYASLSWSETNSKWTISEQAYSPILQSDVASAVFLASDSDGDIIEGTAATLVTSLANQFSGSNIAVAESGGVITYSLTEGTGVHMNAGEIAIGQAVETTSDVQFANISADSIKLADEAVSNVGKALKVGTDGLVTAAAWDEFIAIESGVGLELAVHSGGFKAEIGLAQDIRTSASPQFAGLNLGSAGDALTLYDGSEGGDGSADLKITAIEEMHFVDAYKSGASFGGPLALASASGDWAAYKSAFGEVSLLEAIVAASVGDQYASKFEHVHSGASASSISAWTALGGDITFAELMAMPADSKKARIEVYVNGQLMSQNTAGQNDRDYAFNTVSDSEALEFEFNIENDDVVQIIVR